jgi:putative tryptophan/tyrosine transport system substrate-binding protein
LMSLGADLATQRRRAAVYVDKILRGRQKPASLPVEQPTQIDLVVNWKTAEAIGLSIPPGLDAQVDDYYPPR